MVWPTSSIPTYGRGVWLECDGQTFSKTQFPQLFETLGTTKVPDYRGMFLRGYGSQTYSQDNGDNNSLDIHKRKIQALDLGASNSPLNHGHIIFSVAHPPKMSCLVLIIYRVLEHSFGLIQVLVPIRQAHIPRITRKLWTS